jgi:hypothetical protein
MRTKNTEFFFLESDSYTLGQYILEFHRPKSHYHNHNNPRTEPATRHKSDLYSPNIPAITILIFWSLFFLSLGRESSVCIGTCYRLNYPGIECWWGLNFPHPSRPTFGPIQPLVKWAPNIFPGGEGAEGRRCPPFATSAELKISVDLYL